MNKKQLEEAIRDAVIKEHYKDVEKLIAANKAVYEGDLKEFAFRIAVREGVYFYLVRYYRDVKMNDIKDCWSSYLSETEDAKIIDYLEKMGALRFPDEYSDCKLAIEDMKDNVIVFKPDFYREIWNKFVSFSGLTEDRIAEMLNNDEACEYEFGEEMNYLTLEDVCYNLQVSTEGNTIVLNEGDWEDHGYGIAEIAEALGWKVEEAEICSKKNSYVIRYIR